MNKENKLKNDNDDQIPLEAMVRRTIKFRAWDGKLKGFHSWSSEEQKHDNVFWDIVINENLITMQYTGLKDKKGKDIYEGDIVEIPGWGSGVIKFDRGRFGAQNEEELFYWLGFCKVDHSSYECEVVGNIFENPELL